MTKQWAAGWNAPGYLPDGDGVDPFESWADAAQYLTEELQLEAERQSESGNEGGADALEAA